MPRTEAKTFLDDASRNERFLTGSGVREESGSCLVCGARIGSDDPTIQIRGSRVGSGDPTIQIHGALVHIRCAAYRRRLVRR
jgi:hypothetical protein